MTVSGSPQGSGNNADPMLVNVSGRGHDVFVNLLIFNINRNILGSYLAVQIYILRN